MTARSAAAKASAVATAVCENDDGLAALLALREAALLMVAACATPSNGPADMHRKARTRTEKVRIEKVPFVVGWSR